MVMGGGGEFGFWVKRSEGRNSIEGVRWMCWLVEDVGGWMDG